MSLTLLWFRRDLRLLDNPALEWAVATGDPLLPVYIHAPAEEQPWAPGGASRWWLHHSLQQLETVLASHGLPLIRLNGPSQDALQTLIDSNGVTRLAFNRIYDPLPAARDQALARHFTQQGVEVRHFHSNLLFEPGSILNNQGAPYRVYTPFYKKTRALLDTLYSHHAPGDCRRVLKKSTASGSLKGFKQRDFELLDDHPWHEKLQAYWQPGETGAHDRLQDFIDRAINDYPQQRDLPAADGTSRLSASLHFGEITPQQVLHQLTPLLAGSAGSTAVQAAERFVSQLIWREFAHQVLWFYPYTADQPMNPRYNNRFWRRNEKLFTRWCRGETGVPIVDAGMKQLWESGWMHNRVRMIAASFLTKNLGLSWLKGARWFWDTLVDADLANNAMGWQWVAGSGVDAAPYYRIFNPLTQTRRFDANLQYIDRWLPEHRQLDYPQPVVDLADSRQQALQRYQQLISTGN